MKNKFYSYILGLYLGDGYINKQSRTYKLRIFLDSKHTNVINDAVESLQVLFPQNKVSTQLKQITCTEVMVHSKKIPSMFPQHGIGKKHERQIKLEDWQLDILDWKFFLKGLIHSDGSFYFQQNKYPRFEFSNKSKDIIELFETACEHLGVKASTRYNSKDAIYRIYSPDVSYLKSFAMK